MGPRKKVYVPHFLGKNAKEAHKHKLFRGILGVQNWAPNGPFWATKSLVYCFFPALGSWDKSNSGEFPSLQPCDARNCGKSRDRWCSRHLVLPPPKKKEPSIIHKNPPDSWKPLIFVKNACFSPGKTPNAEKHAFFTNRLVNRHLFGLVWCKLGRQHPSPNVKTPCSFELLIWPEIITSRDAESTCFKAQGRHVMWWMLGNFWPNFGQKRSYHVMDVLSR